MNMPDYADNLDCARSSAPTCGDLKDWQRARQC
jgi:hypothetical protein